MTFLPIVERELRAHARRGRTYWTRFLAALLGSAICLLESPYGRNMFESLVTATFLCCCFAVVLTTDVISWERREGTLGLLFLTRVRSADVLLGKLTSAAVTSLFGLAAFLPVLMLPVLSGGVTGGEVFRIGLMLLDTLFLALAVGLWASARGTEWVKTTRAATLGLLAILLLPPCIRLVSPLYSLDLLSPLVGLTTANDAAYRTNSLPYWVSLLLIQAFGWLLLVRARIDLEQSLREPTEIAPVANVATGSEETTGLVRRLPDGDEPIAWLLRRQKGVQLTIWAAVLLSGFLYLSRLFVGRTAGPGGWAGTMAGAWSLSLLSSIISGGLFAWAAGRFFMEARKTGELELLLTTPLGASTIVPAQWHLLKRMLDWPIVLMLAGMFLPGCPLVFSRPWTTYEWVVPYIISMILGAVTTVAGVVTMCWLGLWFGLHARTPSSAIAQAVVWGKLIPFVVGVVCSFVLWPLLAHFVTPTTGSYVIRSWLPTVATLVFYWWLFKRVRRLLRGELRDAVPLARNPGKVWADSLTLLRRARHWTPTDSK